MRASEGGGEYSPTATRCLRGMADDTNNSGPLVWMYTKKWCGYCFAARRLLRRLQIDFDDISLDGKPVLRRRISQQNGGWPTVPMIFVNGLFVGGFTELRALHRNGGLLPKSVPPPLRRAEE